LRLQAKLACLIPFRSSVYGERTADRFIVPRGTTLFLRLQARPAFWIPFRPSVDGKRVAGHFVVPRGTSFFLIRKTLQLSVQSPGSMVIFEA
jgi:hypothetical protein